MKTKKNNFLLIFIFTLSITFYSFSQQKEIPLWDKIPNSIANKNYIEAYTYYDNNEINGASKVSTPTLTVFLADPNKSNGTSVIICPGGSYTHLAINKEGYKVAKWLNTLGINAFVLKYRLPSDAIMKDKTIGPLQDAQEAIRMVRRNAEKWDLDPNKIGIMGFSAGGHLASTASTHYDDKVYDSDETSARPDFSILVYPVISMDESITHKRSKTSLLGETPSSDLIEKYSNDKHVDSNTPLTFLVLATDDKTVPVENSINYYMALKENNVPVEMHVYEHGGHGFGLGTEGTNTDWPNACEHWLISNGIL